jgi:hypothetical protein
VRPGPVITTFEIEPAPGVKVNRIVTLQDDLAMALRAVGVRILAPVPGKGVVGIEVANAKREQVFLKEIVESEPFAEAQSSLTLESSINSYETGGVDFLNVLSNFLMVIDAELDYHLQVANHEKALARLEEVTGLNLIQQGDVHNE